MAGESKQPQIAVAEAIHLLQMFRGADLTQTIYQIEKSLKGASAESYSTVLTASGAKAEVLGAAGLVKQLAGQINVVIHALGDTLVPSRLLRQFTRSGRTPVFSFMRCSKRSTASLIPRVMQSGQTSTVLHLGWYCHHVS